MEEMYVNIEHDKPVDSRSLNNQTGLRSSERRFLGVIFLSLGLLSVFLLVGLIIGVHHHVSVRGSAADLATIQANLTERLQACDNQLSSLTEERDLLNSSLAQVTKELNRLQNHVSVRGSAADLATIQANLTERLQASDNQLSSLTEERDLLNSSLAQVTKELNRLQNETCPVGWRMLSESCYFFSHDSGSWDKGRSDCKDRGADLVVVNSLEEQTFLFELTKTETWIGLSDRDEEGTWKWVDGTPLTLTFWMREQPDNGGGDQLWGEEDCAFIITYDSLWNDLSCNKSMRWICEKTA